MFKSIKNKTKQKKNSFFFFLENSWPQKKKKNTQSSLENVRMSIWQTNKKLNYTSGKDMQKKNPRTK